MRVILKQFSKRRQMPVDELPGDTGSEPSVGEQPLPEYIHLPNGETIAPDAFSYFALSRLERGASNKLRSKLCQQADFLRDDYVDWMERLCEVPRLHRKQWEFYFICKALAERGRLSTGCRGLGFGVGLEPLPALFASYGVEASSRPSMWCRKR